MLGAAHAAANPLTARYGVQHGHAVGLMLPAVVRFNSQDAEVAPLYHQLAVQGGLLEARTGQRHAGQRADRPLPSQLSEQTGLPQSLDGMEVSDGDIEALAADAAQQWTGTFNPRPVGTKEFVGLYREVLLEEEGDESR